jgi:hypothetical protein
MDSDRAERKRLYEEACYKEEQYYERERSKAELRQTGSERKRSVPKLSTNTKCKLQRQIEKQRRPYKAHKPVSW